MNALRALALWGLAFALSGCADTKTAYHWTRAGTSDQQHNTDWYQCIKENTTTGLNIDSWNETVKPTQNTNNEMVVQCMKARGYTLLEERRIN
jgi:hypothetical protein